MTERTVRCSECGRKNRLPEGWLVEARCGRCDWPLTSCTWIMTLLRRRSVSLTLQATVAAVGLVFLFGSDVAEWWASEPFRLDARVAETSVATSEGAPSLATDPGPGETIQ